MLRLCAFLALTLAFYWPPTADAQWEALHPGGGGQIQDIQLDPSEPGRLYTLSDVDGLYRSDNYGASFRSLNENLHTDATAALAIDPSDSDRLFLGTARGVLRSSDGGSTWAPMADTEKLLGGDPNDRTGIVAQTGINVAAIEIDPVEPDRVYFANSWGWKHTYNFYWQQLGFNQTSDIIHPGQVYVTGDGGETWDIVTFEPESQYMDVYSIEVNPAANNEVYLAAHPGVYKSTDYGQTWDKLPTPADAFYSRGLSVTPDGNFLVAAYTIEPLPAYPGDTTLSSNPNNNKGNANSAVYTSPVQNGTQATWLRRDLNLPQLEKSEGSSNFATGYWRPRIDPRSNATDGYAVLLGTMLGRQGLYSATFFPNGSYNLDDASWERILWREGKDGFVYDQGWDDSDIFSRYYDYTPTTWPDRRIWATGGQSLFEGDPSAGDWPKGVASWEVRTALEAGTAGPYTTYTSPGLQSTVNYDQDALGSYVVQTMADNGVLESFDGGRTWTKERQPRASASTRFPNARAVEIFEGVSPAITLAAAGTGFAGGKGPTYLHALISDAPSPNDEWLLRVDVTLNRPIQDHVSSIVEAVREPGQPQGVYLSYAGFGGNEGGIYYHPDVEQLARGQGQYDVIRAPSDSLDGTSKLMAHPSDPDILYRITSSSLFRMDRNAQGDWITTKLAKGASDFTVWEYAGRTYVAFGQKNGDKLLLSDDGGDTFQTAWTPPASEFGLWDDWLYTEKTPVIGGFVARGDELYFGVAYSKNRRSIGYYKATLDASGPSPTLAVENWTGSERAASKTRAPART